MLPTLEAEYRRQYDNLPHRNITFQMFMSQQENKRTETDYWAELFQNQTRRGRLNYEVNLETKPNPDSVQRTIVIDGANVMHCGSSDEETRAVKHHCIPDVLALLAVMRYFVVNDFDVIVVISHKYQKEDATNYCVAIRELMKENLCTVSHQTNLDDVTALEFAAHVNGVVLTSDYYIDHQCQSRRYESMCGMNWMGIDWKSIRDDKNTLTANGKHFVPSKIFYFKSQNKTVLGEDSVKKMVFAEKDDVRYAISKERRESSWNHSRKQHVRLVLTLLNRLIVEGITVCPINVQRIREAPVPIPIESQPQTQQHQSDLDDEEW